MPRPLKLLKHRHCETCNELISLFPSEIKRDKGIFCSIKCASKFRKTKSYRKMCKNCCTIFKTLKPEKEYCCIECQEEYTKNVIQPKLKEQARKILEKHGISSNGI